MKVVAILLVVLALVAGVVPQFTDCQSRGKALELPNGKSVPMRCHWTARAEIAVAVPVLLCGVWMFMGQRKEIWLSQAVMAMVLGVFVILLPTGLIGVCAKADMMCHALMKPVLTLAGILVVALGVVGFLLAGRAKE
jgi:hypothetical protein